MRHEYPDWIRPAWWFSRVGETVHYDSRGRWDGTCPRCGANSLMISQPPATRKQVATCRNKCGFLWFPDSPTDEVTEAAKYTDLRRQEEERLRHEKALRALRSYPAGRYLSKSLDTPEGRRAWSKVGISQEAIRRFRLGYIHEHRFWVDDETWFVSPALSFPYYWNDNIVFALLRVLRPAMGFNGRYRPYIRNLRPMLWCSYDPARGGLNDRTTLLLVEGAKKAIVLNEALGNRVVTAATYQNRLRASEIEQLELLDIKRIVYLPDPPTEAVHRKVVKANLDDLGVFFPSWHVTVAELPNLKGDYKIDDWIREEHPCMQEIVTSIQGNQIPAGEYVV